MVTTLWQIIKILKFENEWHFHFRNLTVELYCERLDRRLDVERHLKPSVLKCVTPQTMLKSSCCLCAALCEEERK